MEQEFSAVEIYEGKRVLNQHCIFKPIEQDDLVIIKVYSCPVNPSDKYISKQGIQKTHISLF